MHILTCINAARLQKHAQWRTRNMEATLSLLSKGTSSYTHLAVYTAVQASGSINSVQNSWPLAQPVLR